MQVPVLGTYMQSAEHILISRTSRKSQLESLKSAIKTLGLNRDVFIFPEGTRSLDGPCSLELRVEGVGFGVLR